MAKIQNYIGVREIMILCVNSLDANEDTSYLQKRQADLPHLLCLSFLKI